MTFVTDSFILNRLKITVGPMEAQQVYQANEEAKDFKSSVAVKEILDKRIMLESLEDGLQNCYFCLDRALDK